MSHQFTPEERIRGGKRSHELYPDRKVFYPDECAEGGRTAHELHPELYTRDHYREMGRRSAAKRGSRLTDVDVHVIADLRSQGMSWKMLGAAYRLHPWTVKRALRRTGVKA